VDEVVLKAVAPNPASRHQSAAILAAELRAVAATIDAREATDDEEEHAQPPGANIGRALTIAALILLSLVLLIWWAA
jgi:hypothetical protein